MAQKILAGKISTQLKNEDFPTKMCPHEIPSPPCTIINTMGTIKHHICFPRLQAAREKNKSVSATFLTWIMQQMRRKWGGSWGGGPGVPPLMVVSRSNTSLGAPLPSGLWIS